LRVEADRTDWPAGGPGGQRIETANYRLYTTTSSRILADVLPGFLEAARKEYLHLTGLSDATQDGKFRVYVLATWKQWARITKDRVRGPSAGKILTMQAGGYFHPDADGGACVFWNIGGSGTYSLAAHEGLHQFLHARLAQPLPKWLEEGLCTLTEGLDMSRREVIFRPDKNPVRRRGLGRALAQDRWIPLETLASMDAGDALGHDPDRPLAYYGQLWSLARFLLSRDEYARAVRKLVADAEAGRLHEALGISAADMARLQRRPRSYNRLIGRRVLEAYFGDVDTLSERWRRFATELVYPHQAS
jgi:hypothetical protein